MGLSTLACKVGWLNSNWAGSSGKGGKSQPPRITNQPIGYPFVTLGLREASGQAHLGNESQRFSDSQVREQLVMLAHVRHTLLHQLARAGLPIDPDLPRFHLATVVSACDHIQ